MELSEQQAAAAAAISLSPNTTATNNHHIDELGLSPPSSPPSDPDPDPPPSDLHQRPLDELRQVDSVPAAEEAERSELDGFLKLGLKDDAEEEEEVVEKKSCSNGGDESENERQSVQSVQSEQSEQSGWGGGGGGENKSEDAGSGGDDVEKKAEESSRRYQYPVRPEAEDCSYYLKTGSCKFGSNCKFNHPVRRKGISQVSKDKGKEMEDSAQKPSSQIECKYYLRSGGCKYGKACRYSHSKGKPSVAPFTELNFLGLPIRPGERECPYYMRNGSCKYASNCRFNHPDPTATGLSDSPSGYGNGDPASLQGAPQSTVGPWPAPRSLNEPPAYVPMMIPPSQGVPSQNTEWNGYQAPSYLTERSMSARPPFIMNNSVTETSIYKQYPQQTQVDEFPERPGQPFCSYFLRTGDCKFKSNCKYHHPKAQTAAPPPPACELSDKGLPLRPDQNICTHYSRYGICKYGPACKFDHPLHITSSTTSRPDQLPFSDSTNTNGAGIAGSRSGTEATSQPQPV